MSIYKCKMCGGALEIGDSDSVAVCEYCGTKQTVPKLDSEKRANLYDRANHFFRNDEFDKAMGIYEQILGEDKTDAEAYWSIVLCRYGVEYVEDPATYKRVPTVNRTQFTSILADEDYKSALEYADGHQKSIYEEQAKIIDKIQKDILAISQQEEPFDVFICYKETDNGGRRTPDSVLANELYHELNEEGFKVFFSRITLEDKIGTAYEPYIFSALNSAKVMVVLGTRAEYFQAAWVKNEWSRYLALIRNGEKKMLIPAYRDMDPYDLPEEFSHLQAQDMSKLGFMQDLVRGIKKIAQVEAEKPVVERKIVTTGGDATVSSLLKRVFLFLEDDDFENAEEYCERVLDIEPECGEAYLGKLMVELEVERREELADLAEPFEDSGNYQKILRFGDKKLVAEVEGYNNHIVERIELERQNKIYKKAAEIMLGAVKAERYKEAAELFESIEEYEDSESLARECRGKERAYREKEKDWAYEIGVINMAKETVSGLEVAVEKFNSISGWKDADEQVVICRQRLEVLKKKEIVRKRWRRVIASICGVLVVIAGMIVVLRVMFPNFWNEAIMPFGRYKHATILYNFGKYEEAYRIYQDLGMYEDSVQKARQIKNEHPVLAEVGDYIDFGEYEQDNNLNNGKETIGWRVIAKEEEAVILMSVFVLDCQPYDVYDSGVKWEESSLRKWLNGEFYNGAFSEKERSMIVDYNSDKVSIMDGDDWEQLPAYSGQAGIATSFAQANGVTLAGASSSRCWWWVRTDDERGYGVAAWDVENGVDGTASDIGVRPVIRVRAREDE